MIDEKYIKPEKFNKYKHGRTIKLKQPVMGCEYLKLIAKTLYLQEVKGALWRVDKLSLEIQNTIYRQIKQ